MRIKAFVCCTLVLLSCNTLADDKAMDAAQARAMLNRFGYGTNSATLASTVGMTPHQYLQRAIKQPPQYPEVINQLAAEMPAVAVLWPKYGPGGTEKMEQPTTSSDATQVSRQPRELEGRKLLNNAVALRLLQSANSDNQGHEVLLNFWLNHFSVHGLKTLNKFLMADYAHNLQQAMVEDNFLALLRASFFHPAMQMYLDNHRSIAPDSKAAQRAKQRGENLGLNENLARELLELHTLGVDAGYSQTDVQALARIITGAGVLNNKLADKMRQAPGVVVQGAFLFDPNRHDSGEKQLLGKTYPAGQGIAEIEHALQQLAQHPATAQHISRKLALRFLSDQPPAALVERMAAAFRSSNGRISTTLQVLLDSKEFADSLTHPSKFKEPIDYVLSAARTVCDTKPIANPSWMWRVMQDFGQAPYMHTTPDGYGALESDWLSPPAMIKRVRIAQGLAFALQPIATLAEQGKAASSCQPNLAVVLALVGPLSQRTQDALAGLNAPQEIAALLASPEFMRR